MPDHEDRPTQAEYIKRYRRATLLAGLLLILALVCLVISGISIANTREELATLQFESTIGALQADYNFAFLLHHGVLPTQGYSVLAGTPAPSTVIFQATQIVSAANTWTPIERDFGDGIAMMQVPPGCTYIGSGRGAPDEIPVNEVCFTDPFWIDKTEVTNIDFERLGGVRNNALFFPGDQRPVETISWFEARDFCALRGEQTNSDVRLPTEVEWEYAARGANSLIYPWGNEWQPANAVWNENARGAAEVGSLPQGTSWVGALDMSGNVWEWTSTTYGIDLNGDYEFDADDTLFTYPYDASDGRESINDDGAYLRVLRGGSLWNSAEFMRSSVRYWMHPALTNFNWGFRCARSETPIPSDN